MYNNICYKLLGAIQRSDKWRCLTRRRDSMAAEKDVDHFSGTWQCPSCRRPDTGWLPESSVPTERRRTTTAHSATNQIANQIPHAKFQIFRHLISTLDLSSSNPKSQKIPKSQITAKSCSGTDQYLYNCW